MVIGTPGEMGDPPTHLTEPNDALLPMAGFLSAKRIPPSFRMIPAQIQRAESPSGKQMALTLARLVNGVRKMGSFEAPHSLAMDSQGRLFVADRGNNRIQIFTQDGEHIDTWYQFSRNSGIWIDKSNDWLYAIDSESDPNYNPDGWRKGLRVGSAKLEKSGTSCRSMSLLFAHQVWAAWDPWAKG